VSRVVLRMRRERPGEAPEPRWPGGVSVRTLEPDDAPGVHALLEHGYRNGGGEVAPFPVWWRDLCLDEEFDPDLCFLAVEEATGRVLGVAQCWTSAFVKDLAVHEDARRRGIGLALLHHAFRVFAARGAEHVDLKVDEDNATGAPQLYEAAGMTVAGMQYDAACDLSDVSEPPRGG
jgi:ribosomal protein S18 acetylase RimI-like enzyme